MTTPVTGGDLHREFRCFAGYIAGARPSREHEERYVTGIQALSLHGNRSERALLDRVRRFPLLLGPLDAATAMLRPGHLLRRRLLLAAAILETTPSFARHFLPRHRGVVSTVLLGLWAGGVTLAKLVVGVPLFLVLESGR